MWSAAMPAIKDDANRWASYVTGLLAYKLASWLAGYRYELI